MGNEEALEESHGARAGASGATHMDGHAVPEGVGLGAWKRERDVERVGGGRKESDRTPSQVEGWVKAGLGVSEFPGAQKAEEADGAGGGEHEGGDMREVEKRDDAR